MPPSRSSSMAAPSSSSSAAAAGFAPMVAALMDQTIQKQRTYRDHVGGNHAHTKMAAMRLALGGQLERLLLLQQQQQSSSPSSDDNEEQQRDVREFLDAQRQRLQHVAQCNADNERMVTSFLAAVQQVKQEALHQHPQAAQPAAASDQPSAAGDTTSAATTDYVEVLQRYMVGQQQSSEEDRSSSSMANNKYVREVLIELKLAKEKVDDDGEIELVDGEEGNHTQGASLKCPITCK